MSSLPLSLATLVVNVVCSNTYLCDIDKKLQDDLKENLSFRPEELKIILDLTRSPVCTGQLRFGVYKLARHVGFVYVDTNYCYREVWYAEDAALLARNDLMYSTDREIIKKVLDKMLETLLVS